MELLIICDTFPPERVGSYRMYDLAINLPTDKVQVTVIAPPPTFPFGNFKHTWKLMSMQYHNNIKIINLWTWQPRTVDPNLINRILYYLVMPLCAAFWIVFNHNFEIIITSSGSSPFPFLPGLLSKLVFKKKWVIDIRDLFVDGAINLGFLKSGSIIERLGRYFEEYCYSHADFISVVSPGGQKGIMRYNFEKDKLVLIQNATNTDIFYPRKVEKKRQLVLIGNLGYASDFECLILAMKRLIEYDIKLLIVGGGDVQEKLKASVKNKRLDDYIVFTGLINRTKVPEIISESLIGLATIKKGLDDMIPAKLYDYMACEVPFVACGSQNLREFAESSGAGMVVDNDPEAIAKSIKFLIEHPEIRKNMGQNGREYCEKYNNRKIMANNFSNLFEKLTRH